jgi:hypothetical protein
MLQVFFHDGMLYEGFSFFQERLHLLRLLRRVMLKMLQRKITDLDDNEAKK